MPTSRKPDEEVINHRPSPLPWVKPQILLSFGPDGLSNHPDHMAVGKWAAEVFRRVEEISALYTLAVPRSLAEKLNMRQIYPVPDDTISLTVDIASVWDKKMAALRCHATQWSSSPMASASEECRRLFFGKEYFVRAASRDRNTDFLPDILEGYLI